MSITLTEVVGPVVMPDGSTPTNGAIIFQMTAWDKEDGEAAVVPAPISAILDGSGNFSVNLWSTSEGDRAVTYAVSVQQTINGTNGKPKTHDLGRIATMGSGPFEIMDLLAQPIPEPTAPDVLALCLAAQTITVAAAVEVAQIADDFGDMATAIAAATDARDASEDARDLSQKYSNEAEDVEVVADEYSAKHFSLKSAEQAGLAEDQKDLAVIAVADVATQVLLAAGQADRAENAAGLSEDAVNYDYFVDDGTDTTGDLGDLTGMVATEKAYVRDTEHVWEYDGADWLDLGPSPSAIKANRTELEVKADKSALAITDERTGGIDDFEGRTLGQTFTTKEIVTAAADEAGNISEATAADGTKFIGLLEVFKRLAMGGFEVPSESSQYAFALADAADNLALAVLFEGGLMTASGDVIDEYCVDWDFALIDADGNVGFGIKDGKVFPETSGAGSSLDARNKSFSDQVKSSRMFVQLPTAVYNALVGYGQSLSAGNETWPSLSKSPQSGALMIGDNVTTQSTSSYIAMGTDQFNPLVAHTFDAGVNLDGAEEALLEAGSQLKGEPPIVGMTNGLKHWFNGYTFDEDNGKNLVAISTAQGGKTIEQLSKGNTQDATDRYSGIPTGVELVVTLAGADTCVCPVVTWLQGESDYAETSYSTSTNKTRILYAGKLNQLFDDINTDVPLETGQTKVPLKVMYQTGAAYTRDEDQDGLVGLHIGMAQLDVALSRDDTVMAGPAYPHSDKGGHLDSNGARWFGHQMSKVTQKVWAGEGWEPLRPIDIVASSKELLVSFHVPVPPLRFNTPYVVSNATSYEAKGFRVTSADGSTVYGISDVEIVSDTVVRITCGDTIPADALLWYAAQAGTNGNGNLCDSDPSVAIDSYEYVPERGMYAAANIPALIDKPYPLENWCVAFCYPLTFTEFS